MSSYFHNTFCAVCKIYVNVFREINLAKYWKRFAQLHSLVCREFGRKYKKRWLQSVGHRATWSGELLCGQKELAWKETKDWWTGLLIVFWYNVQYLDLVVLVLYICTICNSVLLMQVFVVISDIVAWRVFFACGKSL